MSIFDKLKSTAKQAVNSAANSAAQAIGSKRETFTFTALPESLAEMQALFVAGEAYDRGDSSVRAYVFHEEELVVHRGFHVSHSVHLTAHRLSFEPDSVVAAAFDKHGT